MSVDYYSIGSRIRYYRLQKAMTQQSLADVIGISRVHLSYLESGERGISLETLINIANALSVPADELLVDNLTASNSQKGGDDYYILLDCTPDEATILVKNMKDLRETLRRYTIK